MSNLRLLILDLSDLSGSFTCLSNELRYVEWHYYPFKYLPSSFQPNQLVELFLKQSSIKQLWKGKKHLPNLRSLDLSNSENLIKMPDFGETPNLERLNLEGCVKLVQIDPSIGVLRKLVYLNLKDCYGLRSISSNIFALNTLKYLNLSGVSKAFKNPVRHWKKVDTSESASHSQSKSSNIFKRITLPLPSLSPRAHTYLLPSPTGLICLRELDISFCGLSQIPDAIGCLHWLKRLNLEGNNFVTLPSLEELSKLVYLNLQHCKQLKSMPDLPSSPSAMEEEYSCNESVGLFVFNCPELGNMECYSNMAFSWMIKFIHANQLLFDDDISIIIPGSEIPKWFINQRMDGFTYIDPVRIMHDNNIIGIACCAVFYDPADATDKCSCDHIELYFRVCYERYGFSIPVIIERKHITVNVNHMFLMYIPREKFLRILSFLHKTPWGLYDVDMEYTFIELQGSHVTATNTGYRWVLKEDLQQMHCRNSLARKCEFLAIEFEDKAEEQPQPESFI